MLSCNVSSCASHQWGCCCRPAININGENANKSSDTICDSYMPKGSGTNSVEYSTPNYQLDISCSARGCKYNSSSKCTSQNVQIEYDGAKSMCKTFTCK